MALGVGRLRHTVTVIPGPNVLVIKVLQAPAAPGVTLSDWIRWIGVGVAITGLGLATPDGIASAWRSIRSGLRKTSTLIKRLTGQQRPILASGGLILPKMGVAGRGYVDTWKPWSDKARTAEKLDILHQQSEELRRRIDNMRTQIDGDISEVEKKIREAEHRLAAQIRQVSSELSGERSQASHVDARGLLPVALGIILTGLPDELVRWPHTFTGLMCQATLVVTWPGGLSARVGARCRVGAKPGECRRDALAGACQASASRRAEISR